MNFPKTLPWVKDFFDPQNKVVMVSDRENLKLYLHSMYKRVYIKTKSKTIETKSSTRNALLNWSKTPLSKECAKLLYTIKRITLLSKLDNILLFLVAQLPQNLCNNRPNKTGRIISIISPAYTSNNTFSVVKSKNRLIQSGVKTTPIKPEILALKIAAGTLPLASDTMTTDDETVEGSAARKKSPIQLCSVRKMPINGRNKSTMSGKIKKVDSWIRICNFQLLSPVLIC